MSRRIQTGRAPSAGRGVVATGPTGAAPALEASAEKEDYAGRLLKYIPAEVVGFYVAAAALFAPATRNQLWVIFALGFVLVPIYFYFVAARDKNKKPLWPQIILATVAYPVWVFALGGPFATYKDWYSGPIASLVLIFVTVVFGMYQPKEGS